MSSMQLSHLGKVNKQQFVVMVVGGVVYGILWGLSQLLTLPSLLFISLRPAVAIPIFCGLVWGPITGFVVGALGMFLGDFIAPGPGFPLYWDVSAGLLGLVAGFSVLAIKNYNTWRTYLAAEIWALAAVYVSLDYITVRQVTYEALSQDPWASIFRPVFLSHSANALILVPILIWGYQRFLRDEN